MDARGVRTVAFISARTAVVFAKRKPRGMRQVIDKNVGVVIANGENAESEDRGDPEGAPRTKYATRWGSSPKRCVYY